MLSSLYTKYPGGGVVNVKQKVHPTGLPYMDRYITRQSCCMHCIAY